MENRRGSQKLAFFIGSMERGGAERVISKLSNYFINQNYEVDIILLLKNKISYQLDDNIKVIDCVEQSGTYYSRIFRWRKRIINYIENEKPDCLVSFIGRINCLVTLSNIGFDIPIIVSERNDPLNDGRNKLILKICDLLYRRSTKIVFQTKYQQSCFSNKVQIKSIIINNPVCVSVKREKINTKKIVSVGRLEKQKNYKLLIDSFAILHNKYPSYKLTIFGEGSLRNQLELLVKDYKLEKFVSFRGSVSDVHEQIKNASLFIMTSNYEGASNALIEAMLIGIPCISTDYPGADEIIKEGINGYLVPCDNKVALFNKMENLLCNNLNLQIDKKNSSFANKYSSEQILAEWEKLIQSVI